MILDSAVTLKKIFPAHINLAGVAKSIDNR